MVKKSQKSEKQKIIKKSPFDDMEITEVAMCTCCAKKSAVSSKRKLVIDSKINSNAIFNSEKVKYLTQNQLKSINLYLRSIVGVSYLNLDAFNKTFKVFFADQITDQIKLYLNYTYPGLNVSLVQWPFQKKTNVLDGFRLFGDFLGITITQVFDFDSADYIACLANGIGTFGNGTFPFELDAYPDETGGKLYTIFSNESIANNWSPGSYYFYIILHVIGHTLGLANNFDSGNESLIMPSMDFINALIGPGMAYVNNPLSTIMTYYQILPSTFEKESTQYTRTLMSLDLQALRFYYNVGNNPNYYTKWVDFNCPSNVTQTLVSPPEGATLNLSSTVANCAFNLNLIPCKINPFCDGYSPYDLLSSNCQGYNPKNSPQTFFAVLIDSNSYVSKVNCSYPILNIFAGTIDNNVELNLDVTKTLTLQIYLKGKSIDYEITDANDIRSIKNKVSGKIISIMQVSKIQLISIIFSINE